MVPWLTQTICDKLDHYENENKNYFHWNLIVFFVRWQVS